MAARGGSTKWVKGQSGNPGGRVKVGNELRDLAQTKTVDAINTLYEIMMNKQSSDSARVGAANGILDRGWGKPLQAISDPDGEKMTLGFVMIPQKDD